MSWFETPLLHCYEQAFCFGADILRNVWTSQRPFTVHLVKMYCEKTDPTFRLNVSTGSRFCMCDRDTAHLVVFSKWTELCSLLRYWLPLLTTHYLLWPQKLLALILTSIFPAVLMCDLTLQAGVQREDVLWAPWLVRTDVTCPTVGTGIKRARPAFHVGHTSCVCMSLNEFVVVSELSHCSQLQGWCEVTSAQWERLLDLAGIPHFTLAPPTYRKA